jgi:hypothetical protein
MTWYTDVDGDSSGVWISFGDFVEGAMLDLGLGMSYTF